MKKRVSRQGTEDMATRKGRDADRSVVPGGTPLKTLAQAGTGKGRREQRRRRTVGRRNPRRATAGEQEKYLFSRERTRGRRKSLKVAGLKRGGSQVNPLSQHGDITREGAAERQADSVWKAARPTTPFRRKPRCASMRGGMRGGAGGTLWRDGIPGTQAA